MLRGFLSMPINNSKAGKKTSKNRSFPPASKNGGDLVDEASSNDSSSIRYNLRSSTPSSAAATFFPANTPPATSAGTADHLQQPNNLTKITVEGGSPTVNASTSLGVAGFENISTTTLPPMPPMPPPLATTVGDPKSLQRMTTLFDKMVNKPPRTTVADGGGSGNGGPLESKRLDTVDDVEKSLDFQATSPKSHEPKSFANLFKEAANIRTKGKLRFIPPVFTEVGTLHANIPDELLMRQNEKWLLTLVGSFVGKRPAFPFVKFHAFRLWKKYGLIDVILNDRGFFYFKFDNDIGMQKVKEMRPWLFNDIPVLLKPWEAGIEFDKIRPTSIHLWVNFYDLTPVMWDYEILSHIVSVLGVPLAVDRYTEEMCDKNSGRAAFARVLLRVNADRDLPPFVEAKVLGQMEKFRVQYLWKPDRCSHCNVFGHTFIGCTDRQKSAEEMEDTIPSTSNVAGPSGTKQVPIDLISEQGFIQPKRRKRRPKKAQQATGIVISKPKVKYVPKMTADPKGKEIMTLPETTGSSDSSLPVRTPSVELPVQDSHSGTHDPAQQEGPPSPPPVLSTGNQFDVLCRLNTRPDTPASDIHLAHEDIDINSVPAPDHQSDNATPTCSTILETRTAPVAPGLDLASLREEVDATKVVGALCGMPLDGFEAQIESLIRSGYSAD